MRVSFNEIFEVKDGTIIPKHVVNLGIIQIGPGVSFGERVSLGDTHLIQHIGNDLEVEKDQATGAVTILGVYRPKSTL